MNKMNDIGITLDVDWAPDFAIERIADRLIENGVKATWFVTHASPAIDQLASKRLFELGIHPNFMKGTTQGNPEEYGTIMHYLKQIVPNAKSVRTHGLFQSSNLLRMMVLDWGIKYDSSIYLKDVVGIRAFDVHYSNKSLRRIPFFWTEDGEMEKEKPLFRLGDGLWEQPGIKVFAFHPIHIFLNSVSMERYNLLKQRCNIPNCPQEIAKQFVYEGRGTQTLFEEVIKKADEVKTISEIGEEWSEILDG